MKTLRVFLVIILPIFLFGCVPALDVAENSAHSLLEKGGLASDQSDVTNDPRLAEAVAQTGIPVECIDAGCKILHDPLSRVNLQGLHFQISNWLADYSSRNKVAERFELYQVADDIAYACRAEGWSAIPWKRNVGWHDYEVALDAWERSTGINATVIGGQSNVSTSFGSVSIGASPMEFQNEDLIRGALYMSLDNGVYVSKLTHKLEYGQMQQTGVTCWMPGHEPEFELDSPPVPGLKKVSHLSSKTYAITYEIYRPRGSNPRTSTPLRLTVTARGVLNGLLFKGLASDFLANQSAFMKKQKEIEAVHD